MKTHQSRHVQRGLGGRALPPARRARGRPTTRPSLADCRRGLRRRRKGRRAVSTASTRRGTDSASGRTGRSGGARGARALCGGRGRLAPRLGSILRAGGARGGSSGGRRRLWRLPEALQLLLLLLLRRVARLVALALALVLLELAAGTQQCRVGLQVRVQPANMVVHDVVRLRGDGDLLIQLLHYARVRLAQRRQMRVRVHQRAQLLLARLVLLGVRAACRHLLARAAQELAVRRAQLLNQRVRCLRVTWRKGMSVRRVTRPGTPHERA